MVTPEELAKAACDDQAWKHIEIRAAAECRATCFRAAINILNDEMAKLSTNGLEAARKQIVKRFGLDRLKRLAPFVQHDENHDFSAMMSSDGDADKRS
jgi:hypothetical protein